MDRPAKTSVRAPGVQALAKALSVLHILAESGSDVDLRTLTARTGLPKSTLFRLLHTLKSRNFVRQDPRTRRFGLGWALVHLGEAAKRQFSFAEVLHPFLEELSRDTGETASLAVRVGNYAVYIDQVVSPNIIKGVPPVGSALDLHCTAVGKMLLSSLSDEDVEEYVREIGLPRRTEHTIANLVQLREELARIRKQGYAVDNEEAEPGGRCIAAGVADGRGSLAAALSITGPTSRIIAGKITKYAELVCRAAARASEVLQDRPA